MESAPDFDYYDKVLAAIAVSLGGGALVGFATVVGLREGVLAGSLVATLFVYDALFRHPPKPVPSSRAKVGAVAWHVFVGVVGLPLAL